MLKALLLKKKRSPLKSRANVFFKTDAVPTRNDMLKFQQMMSPMDGYSKFINELRKYGNSEICSNAWAAGTLAYRCYTCARNANMALCFDCFDPDKHIGHDYYKFLSDSDGGKCDCGDVDMMEPEGSCEIAFNKQIPPPSNLLVNAKALLPQLIVKTFQLLMKNPQEQESNGVEYLMLALLEDYADSSVHLRDIIVSTLVDGELYKKNFVKKKCTFEDKLKNGSTWLYEHCKEYFSELVVKKEINKKKCLLDAVFLWAVSKRFNSRMFNWFLKLTCHRTFKKFISKAFCRNYLSIMWHLQSEDETMKKYYPKVVMLSAQILSSSSLSEYLIKHLKFPHYLLLYLEAVLSTHTTIESKTLTYGNLRTDRQRTIYRPPTQDLQFFFGNEKLHLEFSHKKNLIYIWMDIIMNFQGLNEMTKSTTEVIPPPRPFYAMNADFEICMVPILSLVKTFEKHKIPLYGSELFQAVSNNAIEWLGLNKQREFHISFHKPMFRILFLMLSTDMKNGTLNTKKLVFDQGFVKALIRHPIRTWAVSNEILVGWWINNGYEILEHAKMYKVPHFYAGTVDPDIFMVQMAATQLNPDFLVHTVFENFHIVSSTNPSTKAFSLAQQAPFFIEQCLLYFSILLANTSLSGDDEKELLRSEIISALATLERSREGLIDMIPDRGINLQFKYLEGVDQLIDEVSISVGRGFGSLNLPLPNNLTLTPKVFIEEYDPIIVQMRSVHLGGLDASLSSYYKCVEKENLKDPKLVLWPPYRKPSSKHHPYLNGFSDFLHCQSLHCFIYCILNKFVYGEMRESTLQIAIHLLNMSFCFTYSKNPDQVPLCTNCLVPYDIKYNANKWKGMLDFFNAISDSMELSNLSPNKKKKLFGYHEDVEFRDFTVCLGLDFASAYDEVRSDDTILSLLLKIFKNSTHKCYKPIHMRGPNTKLYGSFNSSGARIGGAEFFIGEVLDKLIKGSGEVLQAVEQYVRSECVNEGESDEEDLEVRKKRIAQERKEKLKKKMQKKSQAFKKANVIEELQEEDEQEETKCCVCLKELIQIGEVPMTVVFITRTNLLGHRTLENGTTYDDVCQKLKNITINPYYTKKVDWFDNLWVQTCGHEIHFSCFSKHMEDIMSSGQRNLPAKKRLLACDREFWCPYCRQLSNGILPSIYTPLYSFSGPQSVNPSFHLISNIFTNTKQNRISFEWREAMQHLMDVGQIHHVDSSFYTNLVRNNVELFLMNRRLITEEMKDKKFFPLTRLFKNVPIVQLFNICNLMVRRQSSKSVVEYLKLLDPSYINERDEFRYCSVKNNLALVDIKQLLVTTLLFMSSCVGSNEMEITKWVTEGIFAGTQLEYILKSTFRYVYAQKLKRSEQKIDYFVEKLTTQLTEFLKFCVVLYYSVVNFPEKIKDVEIYDLWQLYDILLEDGDITEENISSIKCFGWEDETLMMFLKKMCSHNNIATTLIRSLYGVRDLMLMNWPPPKLSPLPYSFMDLYDEFNRKIKGDSSSRKYLQCLVCSAGVSFQKEAGSSVTIKNLVHAEHCGRGTCMMIEPLKNLVHILFDKRTHTWDSIYVDKHGESHNQLTNFKDMYLSEERLHMLENMWLFNNFDIFSKNWTQTIT